MNPTTRIEELKDRLHRRIIVLDGAMGTMIQKQNLSEADFRGERFAAHPCDVKGNNDLLVLTQPELIGSLHREYLEAGADMIETNTFNSTAISMADYQMEHLAYELNLAGATVARKAADAVLAKDPSRPRFVARGVGAHQPDGIHVAGREQPGVSRGDVRPVTASVCRTGCGAWWRVEAICCSWKRSSIRSTPRLPFLPSTSIARNRGCPFRSWCP